MTNPFFATDPARFEQAIASIALPDGLTFLDGAFTDGDGAPFDTHYPATGGHITTVRSASVAQVDEAAAAARAAQRAWGARPARERARVLDRAADAMEADIERLATLVALDNGKTLGGAKGDVHACIEFMRSAAGWATRMTGTTLPGGGGSETLTWREPAGVVGVIMPYNAPMLFCGMKIAAAISVGNTVVAKTPERSPLAPVLFCEYLERAGLPAGVVNVLHGFGDVGAAIVDSDEVDMVSFTGSSVVGARVGARASELLKYALLELGGKSANIVFADAPFDAAVTGSATAIFRNAGQRCFAGSRLLVDETIADRFLEALVAHTKTLRVGDPFHPESQISCLIARTDIDRIQGMVDRAVAGGAILHCGGGTPPDAPDAAAYYLPTVIEVPEGADCDEILREEVFGPVLVLQRFATVEEGIAMANDSQYGLAGGCWTTNFTTAMTAARGVDTGFFWINGYGSGGGVEATIGGRKRSGIGTEKGLPGLEQYTVIKTVVFPSGSESTPAVI